MDALGPERRFFLWVHLFDPHAPYEPPAHFLEQVSPPSGGARSKDSTIARYFGEVAKVDHELGRFFDGLRTAGRLDRTAVLVVADHGEALMTKGEPNHAPFVYDTTMRVPFFVRYPDGYRAGERSEAIVSVVDVAPTLCSALGLEPLEGIDGIDLWRRPDGEPSERRGVYFESYHGYLTYGWAPLSGFADGRGKYIHSPAPELYRPAADREERHDLAASEPTEPYRAAIAEVASRPALPPAGFSDDAGSAARLEAIAQLGYATGTPGDQELPDPLADTDRPVPAERAYELVAFLEAARLLDERQVEPAVALLERILAENPGHLSALEKLALARVLTGDWPAAVRDYERRLSLGAGPPATYVNLGLAYEMTGELEKARASLEEALAIDPEEPTAQVNLERVRARLEAARPAPPDGG